MTMQRRTIGRGSHGASRALLVVAVAAVAVAGAGIAVVVLRDGGTGASPTTVAAEFTEAWSDGDTEAMQALIAEPDPALADQLDGWTAGLRIDEQRHEVVGDHDSADGEARVVVRSTYTLAGLGEWAHEHPLTLRAVDDDTDRDWAVEWGPAAVHPDLQADQRLRATRVWPDRAPILGADEEVIAGPHDAVIVGVEPQRITDRAALASALEEALGLDPAELDRAVDAPGVQPDHFVPLTTLRRPEYEAVREQIFPVPGTVFRETTARGAPTPEFARHLIGRVGEITAARLDELGGTDYAVGDTVGLSGLEAQYETQLAGTPSGTVEIADDEGTVAVLHRVDGTEPQPVRTTIDPAVQAAVEETIGDREDPLAIVVVDAANNVRAVASRPLGDVNRALSGQYPPGSTFKVVTAAALLDHGLAPDTTVDCPGSLVVDGREFTNFESDALGPVPFEEAFVQSCNTAMISAADSLADGALVSTADRFGFNTEYSIGAPVAASRVPEPDGATARAASAIGQAGILATPLHMATVAATVIDGTWEEPTLVVDDEAPAGPPIRSLEPEHRATLDAFMAGVVERGTATAARAATGLRGKTGTAEFGTETPPRTHAWFIGYRNDLAAAILLEDGGIGGQHAAPVAGDLFGRLGAAGR